MQNIFSFKKLTRNIWLAAFIGIAALVSAQDKSTAEELWEDLPNPAITALTGRPQQLNHFLTKKIRRSAMNTLLKRVPQEAFSKLQKGEEILLPLPDGKFGRFMIFETYVMAPELAKKFPEIKTYTGRGIDDPSATVRIDDTPRGFHAQILSRNGAVYIDPVTPTNPDTVISYYKKDYSAEKTFTCLVEGDLHLSSFASETPSPLSASGSQLRTYRIACATTGEFTQFHGGTVASGLAAVVTTINRVTGVYEVELAIRLQLVANNNLLIYTNPATDPYSNSDPGALLNENQTNIDTLIGDANYDIGHVFSTGGGGLAGLGVVGFTGQKAWGETGLGSPIGDVFYIDYVAHEIGHQFGGNHTFNGDSGNCAGGNRNSTTAYEPGSGTTIMAYAGICGDDNTQNNSDPYFHAGSHAEILAHVDLTIPSTGTRTATGNAVPTVSAGDDFTIPAQTPFTLSANGSDADGTSGLTYNWEERDIGPQQDVSAGDNGSSALFRSWTATEDPTRTFPRLTDLLNNTLAIGETLPTTSRTMKFRVTVRDNASGGGGIHSDDMIVSVVNTGSPFVITNPNTALTWPALSQQNVTWDTAGTTGNGINCSAVSIYLSTDGGLTYPTLLAAGTPNDGSQTIRLPNTQTSQARIRVQGDQNIFFDISNTNFTISETQLPFLLEITSGAETTVAPDDAVYAVNIVAFNGFNSPVTLSASGHPAGTSAAFSENPVLPGNSSTLTISGTDAADSGFYPLEIRGTSGADVNLSEAQLNLSSGPSEAVILLTPAQGSTNLTTTPTLTWSDLEEPITYLLEIDDDPAFGSPNYSYSTTDTSHELSTPLVANTPYYWRVASSNSFNVISSETFYFTTATAATIIETNSNPNVAIPDNNPSGITDSIFISTAGIIDDLDLLLHITHTWVGDLTVTLRHVESDTTVILVERPGEGNSSADNMHVVLDDEAAEAIDTSAPYAPGSSYSPNNALSAFDGKPLAGTWEINISDLWPVDTGTLVEWGLYATLEVAAVEAFPKLTISNAAFDETAGTATITASLDTTSSSIVSVRYTTQDDSATSTTDYTASSNLITIDPGETSAEINIPILNDDVVETDERFFIQWSNPTNVIIPASRTEITINDASTPFMIWLDTYGLTLADAFSDGDLDGINALLEYSFNLNPTQKARPIYDPDAIVGPAGPSGIPKINISNQGINSRLQIIFPRRIAAGVIYDGYFCDDLTTNWVKKSQDATEPINAEWEKVLILDPYTTETAPQGKRFGKVEVSTE